jgi:hypothetical protein
LAQVPHDSEWPTLLLASSQRFMRAALKARSRDDDAFFLANAITALEQLTMALLAQQHPLLIVEGRDLNSVLQAVGKRGHDTRGTVKTIDFPECTKRVAALHPSLSGHMASIQRLYKARNSLVHFGVEPDLHDVEDTWAVFNAASALLRSLGVDPVQYYGSYLPYVEAWKHQGESHAVIASRARVAAAVARWSARTRGMDEQAVKYLVTAREAQYAPGLWDGHPEMRPYACPACTNTSCLFGSSEMLRDEPPADDYDDDVLFFPSELRCLTCGLDVVDPAELEALGVPTDMQHRVRVTLEDREATAHVYKIEDL